MRVVESERLVLLEEIVRALQRRMRRVEGDVAEERLVTIVGHELDRRVREHVGDESGRRLVGTVRLEQRIEVAREETAAEAKESVEAVTQGSMRVRVAVVPLAEAAGRVAVRRKYLRQRHLVCGQRLHAAPR